MLKCRGKNYEQIRALEVDPENPEFSIERAVTTYGLGSLNKASQISVMFSLNQEDIYISSPHPEASRYRARSGRRKARSGRTEQQVLIDLVFQYAAKFTKENTLWIRFFSL